MPELRFGPSATPPVLGLMDSAQFHASAYDAVRSIPLQRVTTYGHIARLIGMPNHARQVGQALKFLSPGAQPPIPWHRVINASGCISSRGPGSDGANRQRIALEAEGVQVTVGRTGDLRVDLAQWGWFPSSLSLSDDEDMIADGIDEE